MYPFGKPLDEVTEQDILSLTEEESLRLDYKRDISSSADKSAMKNEFRKDVTAFANTAGGTLVFGVKENNRVPCHWPGVAYFEGKDAENIEKEIVNALATKIDPPLPPSWRCHVVPMTSNPARHFIVIHVPGRSWAAPHWINIEGRAETQFWHRIGTHNKEMGYGALERAFRDRFLGQRALEAFRQERIAELLSGESAMGAMDAAFVLHIVPYSAADGGFVPDLSELGPNFKQFHRFTSHWMSRHTHSPAQLAFYDFQGFGCLCYDLSSAVEFRNYGLARLYRNGASELVDCRREKMNQLFLVPDILDRIRSSVEFQLQLLESLDIGGPYDVFLSLINVKGVLTEGCEHLKNDNYLFPGVRVGSRQSARDDLAALRVHISHTAGLEKPKEFGAKVTYEMLETPWRPQPQISNVATP